MLFVAGYLLRVVGGLWLLFVDRCSLFVACGSLFVVGLVASCCLLLCVVLCALCVVICLLFVVV